MGRGYRSYCRRLRRNANSAFDVIGAIVMLAAIGVYALKWLIEAIVFLIVSILKVITFIVNSIQEHKRENKTPSSLPPYPSLEQIDAMNGEQFEAFVANMLVRSGYTNVSTTRASGDWGVDVVATMNGIVYALQCKRYDSAVGVSPIQEVYAGMKMYDADRAIVVTNSHFTSNAAALAAKLDVALWDRRTIESMMARKYR